MKTKNEVTYSPGQWRIEGTGRHDAAGCMIVVLGDCIASISNLRGNARANAALIASAPDLLAACKMALHKNWGYSRRKIRTALISAISKAEGK